ncbi:MAG: ribonuclease [Bacteroidetes bacterium]|nr:ribonuclease [Bacteroidota bacterium]MBK8145570.1 ribonuclease [Bacteroidota bacterium]MBP6315707.1 hypothetical protein [Chitinophagaceae bacterium]
MNKKSAYRIFGFVVLILLIVGLNKFFAQHHNQRDASSSARNATGTVAAVDSTIPKKVYRVLNYVETYGVAMKGYIGGREFMNRERKLPKVTAAKRVIQYREWDVNPKIAGQNRGAERLVTGTDKSAWFTNDHYRTFKKLK